jgi:hypothetical protein
LRQVFKARPALRERIELPFAGYSVVAPTGARTLFFERFERTERYERAERIKKIVWDDPPSRLRRYGGQVGILHGLSAEARNASGGGTPGNKFPGGHRGRVPPVPIPNTEVKPATADGTACVGVWESRSLPGLILNAPVLMNVEAGAFVFLSGLSVKVLSHLAPRPGSRWPTRLRD